MMPTELKVIDQKIALANEFNKQVGKIIRIAESKIGRNDANVCRVKELIMLGKSIDICHILNMSSSRIWNARTYIENEDDVYFMNTDYRNEISSTNENKGFIEDLINTVKSTYTELKPMEKKEVWSCLKIMLQSVVDYMLLTNN